MTQRVRWSVAVATVVAGLSVWSARVVAQTATRSGPPAAGTWGGEAAVGDGQSATLLRFQTARWALLAGGSVQRYESNSAFGGRNVFTTTSIRLGARRYSGSGLGLRPIVGLGLLIGGASGQDTRIGGYGELGATYFFNPHVSLGVVSDASIVGQSGGGTSFGVSLARLIGAVYF